MELIPFLVHKNWSTEEVAAIVNDYFDMLVEELSGRDYNKSKHRRQLQKLLNERSEGSIEFKHQNISAVLIELGLPYITGYKPLPNYQQLLKDEVEYFLAVNPELEETISNYLASDIQPPDIENILESEVTVPDISFQVSEPATNTSNLPVKRNYYKEELRNRRLGFLGEEFVISYEKQYLNNLGLDSLSNRIEHVSQTKGDYAGFDILSFNKNGDEKFIEVKTTQMGKEAPFYFTRNELGFSREESQRYRLYRVFNFKKEPRFYQLKGALDESCESISTEFIGWPK